MNNIRIIHLKCKRCGHTWVPRIADVKLCARCKSPYWDRPKKMRSAAASPAAER